jgi:hypothetical protein
LERVSPKRAFWYHASCGETDSQTCTQYRKSAKWAIEYEYNINTYQNYYRFNITQCKNNINHNECSNQIIKNIYEWSVIKQLILIQISATSFQRDHNGIRCECFGFQSIGMSEGKLASGQGFSRVRHGCQHCRRKTLGIVPSHH